MGDDERPGRPASGMRGRATRRAQPEPSAEGAVGGDHDELPGEDDGAGWKQETESITNGARSAQAHAQRARTARHAAHTTRS